MHRLLGFEFNAEAYILCKCFSSSSIPHKFSCILSAASLAAQTRSTHSWELHFSRILSVFLFYSTSVAALLNASVADVPRVHPESCFYFNIRSRANWGASERARAFIFAGFHWHIYIALDLQDYESRQKNGASAAATARRNETEKSKIELIPKCETATNKKPAANEKQNALSIPSHVRRCFILFFLLLKFAIFSRNLVWKAHMKRHNRA